MVVHWNLNIIEFQEEVKVLLLNRANVVLGIYELSKGGVSGSIVDIKIVLSVFSPNKIHTAEKVKAVMEKMMQAQKEYLGDVNSTARYDIYLYLSEGKESSPKGFGALEHHTSTVVVLPESSSKEGLASSIVDVVAHEFFHIVTPLSVHSEDVHYFDYDKPTFSKHLWMYEGVTEYFAQHFQVYEGLVDDASRGATWSTLACNATRNTAVTTRFLRASA